jgi:hypothetical protein
MLVTDAFLVVLLAPNILFVELLIPVVICLILNVDEENVVKLVTLSSLIKIFVLFVLVAKLVYDVVEEFKLVSILILLDVVFDMTKLV